MKKRLMVTQQEYNELQKLMEIVQDKNNLPGERRLARAKFDHLYKQILKRNFNVENKKNTTIYA
ncbi:hypothetical protein [Priestia megaterium]|uniref:hypothetical protein n=1 Tax=Priestia megaterium TaxID=1404 RepID=UPI0027A7FEE9|nr:hypothetical protein [Priestia megaterium]WDC90583.1 hypothetical protein PSR56_11260 [Priestia megaterium]